MTTVSVKGDNYDIKVSANIGEQDLVCAVSDFIENIYAIEKELIVEKDDEKYNVTEEETL